LIVSGDEHDRRAVGNERPQHRGDGLAHESDIEHGRVNRPRGDQLAGLPCVESRSDCLIARVAQLRFKVEGEDPRHKDARPDLASQVTVPSVLFQAHSAPLGIAFYTGEALPEEYRGDAFVTFHGSWNRGARTGYKVVRVLFKDGKPTGEYEDFITGFVLPDDRVWGRPVGVADAKDGSLLVTEDGNGTIWRVTYVKRS
jgi:hypothetical protein